ncbi:hypothetical protein B0H12DRAFT_1081500 [Mycena haematopus]|nr:hypothetical protein B0H12DRAFT_1081500 [Mycena haematopus]
MYDVRNWVHNAKATVYQAQGLQNILQHTFNTFYEPFYTHCFTWFLVISFRRACRLDTSKSLFYVPETSGINHEYFQRFAENAVPKKEISHGEVVGQAPRGPRKKNCVRDGVDLSAQNRGWKHPTDINSKYQGQCINLEQTNLFQIKPKTKIRKIQCTFQWFPTSVSPRFSRASTRPLNGDGRRKDGRFSPRGGSTRPSKAGTEPQDGRVPSVPPVTAVSTSVEESMSENILVVINEPVHMH